VTTAWRFRGQGTQTVGMGRAAAGVDLAWEIGPGKRLAGLVKRIDERVAVLSVGDAESLEKLKAAPD